MKTRAAASLLALMLLPLSAPMVSCWGQDIDEGKAAHERGDYATALRELRPLAEQGNVEAQFLLGASYSMGLGVPSNFGIAVKWFRKAADQGDDKAQLNLGFAYLSGKGAPKDYAIAVKWFHKAALQGNFNAQYELGEVYLRGRGVPQDHAAAAKWYRNAAEQGNERAQFSLGYMYANGLGMPQDNTAALKWYRRAARSGNGRAALELDRNAAHQGNANAQYTLSLVYAFPKNPELRDPIKAHKWASLAAAQGHKHAIKLRDGLGKTMTPAQIAEAQKLAREWRAQRKQQ